VIATSHPGPRRQRSASSTTTPCPRMQAAPSPGAGSSSANSCRQRTTRRASAPIEKRSPRFARRPAG